MELKYFIRIEHDNGIGPYSGSNYLKTNFDHVGTDGKHPVVYNDHLFYEWKKTLEGNYPKYCFESMDQMKNWFTKEERILMKDKGFHLKQISSENYFISYKQCVCEIKEYIQVLDWE